MATMGLQWLPSWIRDLGGQDGGHGGRNWACDGRHLGSGRAKMAAILDPGVGVGPSKMVAVWGLKGEFPYSGLTGVI